MPTIRISGLRPAPLESSFEDVQTFLQRAAAQLKIKDQAKEKSRDRSGEIQEQILRDSYEKDIMFDHEIEEDLLEAYEIAMNPKKLAEIEIKLSLTPAWLAARYIRWLHESLGSDEPNPLAGWLKELEVEIHEQYPLYNTHRVFRGGERQLFALVDMYASALLDWFEDFCAAMSMDVIAIAMTTRNQRARAELDVRLADHAHRLRVCATVIQIIEDEYLHESVLPAALRSALDPQQLEFMAVSSPNRSAECSPRLSDAELTAEARARANTIFATALATANLTHCHQLLFSVAQATLTLGDRRRDYDLSMDLLDRARRSTVPSKRPPAASASRRQPGGNNKPRRTTKSTTSTTPPDQNKSHKTKRMPR
jgi:hypothetical protein